MSVFEAPQNQKQHKEPAPIVSIPAHIKTRDLFQGPLHLAFRTSWKYPEPAGCSDSVSYGYTFLLTLASLKRPSHSQLTLWLAVSLIRMLSNISTRCSKLARLEQLEELDLSGNKLKAVPTTILSCQRLHTLAAHSNCIGTFPEVLQLPEIKVGRLASCF